MPSITLANGETHELGKPSFKTLQYLNDRNAAFGQEGFDLWTAIPIIVVALAKRANPSFALSEEAIADLLMFDQQDAYMKAVGDAFGINITDSEDDPERPTNAPTGD